MRYAFLAALPVAGIALATPQSPPATRFEKTVQPYLKQYCLNCHQGATAAAGMTVEPFLDPKTLASDPDTWRHFVQKIRTGQMPPAGSPRADAATTRAVTAWIGDALARNARATVAAPGKVTARRLNRAEYNNTVRDLLGVTVRPADDFPQDDSGYGFDNIGDVLSVSPPLMEKYLDAAEKLARTAIFGPGKVRPRLVELRALRREPPAPSAIPADYDRSGLTLPQAVHTLHRFPADGRYDIHAVLTGLRPSTADDVALGLWVDGKKVAERTYAVQGIPSFPGGPVELYGQRVVFPRQTLSAGEHWVAVAVERLYDGLPPSFGGPNPSKKPEPAAPQRTFRLPEPPPDATEEQKKEFAERRKRFDDFLKQQRAQLPANTRVGRLEVDGPYDVAPGPSARSRALLLTCGHRDGKHAAGCAGKILTDLAARAYRRPVVAADTAPLKRLFDDERRAGASFDESLSAAVTAVLVSPHFLFRIEKETPGTRRLNDHELASRLAYFLWSTMPDPALRRAADAGTLGRPEVLRAQTARMLADPKAETLADNFAGQWLELRKLDNARPDGKFDRFDEHLRLSMRRETQLFVQEIVRNDRPVLEFLDGRYTFVNQNLAEFYGIPGVVGPQFRKVDLSGTPRAGILTQGSVLTLTSYANRTSPVLRGKWILDNLLGTPPPPAPPGVPGLEETKVPTGASLRQQLEEHRKKPLCASCHNRLDPLGFGLENFDAVGAWRTVDGATPVEASGSLPDGRRFSGPQELAAILLQDRDGFVKCLSGKLLTYALGRGLERFDQPTVAEIAAKTARADYRFSALVHAIVASLPFQSREGKSPYAPATPHAAVAPHASPGAGRLDRTADARRHGPGAGGARAR